MREEIPGKKLLLVIGNDARQDDGLGWAFGRAIEQKEIPSWAIEYRYQLQVEDADLIARFEEVVFVDAFKGSLSEGYALTPLPPALEFGFSTHALAPGAILALCQTLYSDSPNAWLMAIAGEAWELETGLSEAASKNLDCALAAWSRWQAAHFSG